ncbi:hypothetical protein QUF54_03325 [Candidatus Marithioploca araucensis]|uniref:Uncharacterized protein n=1 Tax=Candidatus Marithioploca araucensis TaxID=70273 RepID=A0ABT7VRV3_9GAMM|nr:hypothetical protein [Candidatus Marithioploca araucensis]
MEGHIMFDKVSHTLKAGDKLRFFALEIDLKNGTRFGGADAPMFWGATSDLITLTQTPVFGVEKLEFIDEQDNPYKYYYAMMAEDASGNMTLTEPDPLSQ